MNLEWNLKVNPPFLAALNDELGNDDGVTLRRDLVDAVDAILQIQLMYNLTPADVTIFSHVSQRSFCFTRFV